MDVYLRERGASILTVVIGFFTLLTVFSILGINFGNNKPNQIQKIVTIEAFKGLDENEHAFCEKFIGDPKKIHDECKKLSAQSCILPKCCVLTNGVSCVGGDRHGPTFHTENGVEKRVNYYHHKTTCHGNCPAPM